MGISAEVSSTDIGTNQESKGIKNEHEKLTLGRALQLQQSREMSFNDGICQERCMHCTWLDAAERQQPPSRRQPHVQPSRPCRSWAEAPCWEGTIGACKSTNLVSCPVPAQLTRRVTNTKEVRQDLSPTEGPRQYRSLSRWIPSIWFANLFFPQCHSVGQLQGSPENGTCSHQVIKKRAKMQTSTSPVCQIPTFIANITLPQNKLKTNACTYGSEYDHACSLLALPLAS